MENHIVGVGTGILHNRAFINFVGLNSTLIGEKFVYTFNLCVSAWLEIEIRNIIWLINLYRSGSIVQVELLCTQCVDLSFQHIGVGTIGLGDEFRHGDEEMLVLVAQGTGLLDVQGCLCQALAGICLDDGAAVVTVVLGDGDFDCLRIAGGLAAERIYAHECRIAGDGPVAGGEESYRVDVGAHEIAVGIELEGFRVELAFRLGNVLVLIVVAGHGSKPEKGRCRDCEKLVEFHD